MVMWCVVRGAYHSAFRIPHSALRIPHSAFFRTMRTKVTLVLLFLNVALFYYIFQFLDPFRPPQPHSRKVLPPEVAAIERLEVRRTDTAPPTASSVTAARLTATAVRCRRAHRRASWPAV